MTWFASHPALRVPKTSLIDVYYLDHHMPRVDTVQMCTRLHWVNWVKHFWHTCFANFDADIRGRVSNSIARGKNIRGEFPFPHSHTMPKMCNIWTQHPWQLPVGPVQLGDYTNFKTTWNGAMRSMLGVPHKLLPLFLTHATATCYLKHTLKVIPIKSIRYLV